MSQRQHVRDERANEGISALIALPLVLLLLFGTIEVCWYFRTRGLVAGVARDITRGAAADGGTNNPRTNNIGHSWEQEGIEQLTVRQDCQCTSDSNLSISCASGTPPASGGLTYMPAGSATVVAKAGDDIVCSINYPYRSLTVGFRGSWAQALGFDNLLRPFVFTFKARSETGSTT